MSLGLWINQVIPSPYLDVRGPAPERTIFSLPGCHYLGATRCGHLLHPDHAGPATTSSHRAAIFALNLLLGWTVVAWVIALVWALYIGQSADES